MRYKQIAFESTLTKQDYRRAVYFNLLFKSRGFSYFTALSLVLGLLVLVLGLPGVVDFSPYLIYASLFQFCILILLFITMEVNIRQFMKSDKIAVGNIREITVFDDSIIVSSGKGRFRDEYHWPLFYKGWELKNCFLLYINTQQAIILPKRDVPLQDIQPLRNILRQGLGSKYESRIKED